MKNPIPYTKEDIYLIVEMALFIDSSTGSIENYSLEKKEFVNKLIGCLTPEEREESIVKEWIDAIEMNDYVKSIDKEVE